VKGSKLVSLDYDSFTTFENFKNKYRAKSYSETLRAMEREIIGKNNGKQKEEIFKFRV
jgi:hypothetical protein